MIELYKYIIQLSNIIALNFSNICLIIGVSVLIANIIIMDQDRAKSIKTTNYYNLNISSFVFIGLFLLFR